MRILREEPITGMNRIDIANLGCAHDAIDFQITLGARRRADADGFIRKLNVQRIDVRFRINRQSANAELFARSNEPQLDLPDIGKQYSPNKHESAHPEG